LTPPRVVVCPTCGTSVDWTPEVRSRPFCSERCKLIDAGAWASEAYRVPVAEMPDPEDFDSETDDSPIGRKATS
jgi:endogenous inhibitor of DNA gyrase (YacG/DUF329 family)